MLVPEGSPCKGRNSLSMMTSYMLATIGSAACLRSASWEIDEARQGMRSAALLSSFLMRCSHGRGDRMMAMQHPIRFFLSAFEQSIGYGKFFLLISSQLNAPSAMVSRQESVSYLALKVAAWCAEWVLTVPKMFAEGSMILQHGSECHACGIGVAHGFASCSGCRFWWGPGTASKSSASSAKGPSDGQRGWQSSGPWDDAHTVAVSHD